MEHLYPQPFPVQRDSQGGAGPGCGARRVCGGLSFGGPLPAAVTEASVDSGCSGRPRAVTSVGRVPLCKGKTSGRAPRLPPNHLAPKTHPCRRGCVWGGLWWETPLSREPPADGSSQSSHAKGVKAWGRHVFQKLPVPPSRWSPASSPWTVDARPVPGSSGGTGLRWEVEVPGCSRGWCNFLIREVTVLCLLEPGVQWKV